MTPNRSGAHLLVESLLAEGVDTLFGIPGVGTLAVYDAFVDHPGLRHIEVRHEQAAIFMADGYARATGEPGVAFTSNGPGALNTITAMATAHNDSVPLLHLVSENPPQVRRKGRGHFHDISDQFGVFRPVTAHAATVALPDEIPAAVGTAFYALRNRRPRPALIEFYNEAFTGPATAKAQARTERRARPVDQVAITAAAEALARARRSLVWAGGGIATPDASEALRTIVERLGAPVISTQKGKGAIPADHPLHIGNWANEPPVRDLIDNCDLVLAVGTRFSYFPTAGWSLRLPERIVQIDIDPAELGRNYPIEVGVEADATTALTLIDTELDRLGHEPRPWRTEEVATVLSEVREAIGTHPEIEVLDLREAERAWSDLGTAPLVCDQVEFSLVHRDPQINGTLDACRRLGMALLPYYPLASGLLTGKVRRGQTPTGRLSMDRYQRFLTDENFDLVEKLDTYAAERSITMPQLALGWLLSVDGVPSVTPGATEPSQVKASARAADWAPTADDLEQLDGFIAG